MINGIIIITSSCTHQSNDDFLNFSFENRFQKGLEMWYLAEKFEMCIDSLKSSDGNQSLALNMNTRIRTFDIFYTINTN